MTINRSSRAAAWMSAVWCAALLVTLDAPALGGGERTPTIVAIGDAHLGLAPYVWKLTGTGTAARAEATMPGAYLHAVFQGSTTLGLLVDGTANAGCPAPSMPVIEYSVDEGPYKVEPLTKSGEVYTLPLASGLDAKAPHRLALYFRAADLCQARWRASTAHLRLAGLALDSGGTPLPCPRRPQRAIGFGDSITEGVGADGLFTSWQSLGVNNARATWFPIACAALGCEYGQLGSGGHGMARMMEVPPLPQTWDRYDAATSRLTDGKLLPEPDYVFCCLGTNDFDRDWRKPIDITQAYIQWLTAMRKACPTTRFFCIVPPFGWHAAEVKAAVAARNAAGDPRVHLIDTVPIQSGFRPGNRPTQLAADGCHPTLYGHALLGALIAVNAQKVLSQGN